MSEEVGRDYFDQQISEKCSKVREISLRVLNIESQIESLLDEKKSLLRESSSLFIDIRKLADLAKVVLKLEGAWFCALDEGKLMPVKPTTEPSS